MNELYEKILSTKGMQSCKVAVNALKFSTDDGNKIITAVRGGGYRIASEDFEAADVVVSGIDDVITYIKNLG
jgi:hypothetical protein